MGTGLANSFSSMRWVRSKMGMESYLEQLSRWEALCVSLASLRESFEFKAIKSETKSPIEYVPPARYAVNRCLKHSLSLLMMKPAKSSLSNRMEVSMVQMLRELKNSSYLRSPSPYSLKSYMLSTVTTKIRNISSTSAIISYRVPVLLRKSLLRYLRMISACSAKLSLLRNLSRSGVKSCFTFLQKRTQFYNFSISSSLKLRSSSSRCSMQLLPYPTAETREGSPRITSFRMSWSQLFLLSMQSEKSRKRQLSRISFSRYLSRFSGGMADTCEYVHASTVRREEATSQLILWLMQLDSQCEYVATEWRSTSSFSSSKASSQCLSTVLMQISLNWLLWKCCLNLALRSLLLLLLNGSAWQYSWQQYAVPMLKFIQSQIYDQIVQELQAHLCPIHSHTIIIMLYHVQGASRLALEASQPP